MWILKCRGQYLASYRDGGRSMFRRAAWKAFVFRSYQEATGIAHGLELTYGCGSCDVIRVSGSKSWYRKAARCEKNYKRTCNEH
jgi:hypothetical protein